MLCCFLAFDALKCSSAAPWSSDLVAGLRPWGQAAPRCLSVGAFQPLFLSSCGSLLCRSILCFPPPPVLVAPCSSLCLSVSALVGAPSPACWFLRLPLHTKGISGAMPRTALSCLRMPLQPCCGRLRSHPSLAGIRNPTHEGCGGRLTCGPFPSFTHAQGRSFLFRLLPPLPAF